MKSKDRISDMIPGYCNNRLDPDEKAAFERCLQENRELQDELREFQNFQDLYRQADPLEPPPSDELFHQIAQKAGLDRQVSERSRGSKKSSRNMLDMLQEFWQKVRESLSLPWMLAAVQAVAIVILLTPAVQRTTYSTLSTANEATANGAAGFNVVFQPNARESDIRTLLQTINGTVSGGPSQEGRYMVTLLDKKNRDMALETLKHSSIVLFAEPIY